jgi:hypothetical protein
MMDISETGTVTATITVKRYNNGELEVDGRRAKPKASRRDGKFICDLAEAGEEFLLASQKKQKGWNARRDQKRQSA